MVLEFEVEDFTRFTEENPWRGPAEIYEYSCDDVILREIAIYYGTKKRHPYNKALKGPWEFYESFVRVYTMPGYDRRVDVIVELFSDDAIVLKSKHLDMKVEETEEVTNKAISMPLRSKLFEELQAKLSGSMLLRVTVHVRDDFSARVHRTVAQVS